jgi:integrase
MPKHPHILIRDGRYYYRRRIPADLVQAGCYGKAKEIKRALGANNLTMANRLAETVAIHVTADFDTKRRELGKPGKFASSCKSDVKRRFSEISDIEREDFVLRFFISKERAAADMRREDAPEIRQELLWNIREDLCLYGGDLTDPQCNWLVKLRKALEADGITTEETDAAPLREMAIKMQRAAVEAASRTESALSGNPFDSFDPLFKGVHADSPFPTGALASKTIGDMCREFLANTRERAKAGNLAPSTVKWVEQSSKVLADFFGEATALCSITKQDAARLAAFLPTLPKNASKRYKGVSVVIAAERESKRGDKQTIHPKTVSYYFEGISSIFKFAVEWNWLSENPLKGRSLRECMPKVVQQHRQTMSPDEMTRVFSSADFLAQRRGKHKAGEARYWVPLLCLFHGTRSNEVAGMLVSDVENADGIDILNVRGNSLRQLKTRNSERQVPLHQNLIDLGFLEFVAKRRQQAPDGPLFAGLTCNSNGSMADGIGKWWQGFVTDILGQAPANGATGARGLHSLRHSWVAAARDADVVESTWKRLGGWSLPDASDNYGLSRALPMLKEKIDKIEYPGVKFPRVRRIKRD